MVLVQNKYKKHSRRGSEDQDNLRYALIYTPHEGGNLGPQKTDSGLFIILSLCKF